MVTHSTLAFMGHLSPSSAGSPSHHQPLASKMLRAERCTTKYAIYFCASMTFNQSAAARLACLSESEPVLFVCTFAAYKPGLYHFPCQKLLPSCASSSVMCRPALVSEWSKTPPTHQFHLTPSKVVLIVSRLERAKAKLTRSLSNSTSMQAILLSA